MCQWRLSVTEDDNVTKQKIAYSGETGCHQSDVFADVSVLSVWRNNPVSKKKKNQNKMVELFRGSVSEHVILCLKVGDMLI